jgi:putative ABC transport system ATP-binding protein
VTAAPAVLARGVVYAHRGAALGLAHPSSSASSGFILHVPVLRIHPAERVALVGPSGSGKSTLLDLLLGVRTPDEGDVETLGFRWGSMREPDRRRARLASIGMAFQEFELLPYLTARQNIELARDVGGCSWSVRECRGRTDQLAARAGISHVLERPPAHLSQGERQRVALCRALFTRPPLIVGDEPTGNLDAASARAVMDLLLDQARDDGSTVVVVTHDRGLLQRFDRVVSLPMEGGA